MLITDANIVLENEVIFGTIEFENGIIKSIEQGKSYTPSAQSVGNAYIIPGLIELHTDNLDKFFMPRPGVDWPGFSAMQSHDALMIASGITTVFDAISIGDERDGGHRLTNLTKMLDAINYANEHNLTRAMHLIHLRCELPSEHTLPLFEFLSEKEDISLVSLMDHSPGQRQYTSLAKYREYFQGKYHMTNEEMALYEMRSKEKADQYSAINRLKISQSCKDLGIVLASHDDATIAHVDESRDVGCTIAEFPTTFEAALHSKELGLSALMGAPNVIRGGSHSGNLSASHLASKGALDILSSDYYPQSLLQAAFEVYLDNANSYDLPSAINLVTANPAKALNLYDRGQIAVGKRADLVIFDVHSHNIDHSKHAFIKEVFTHGIKVF
ncbi:alpha-D-ribose 1-methylphosphonate 5-triphosphate diphosphatase [Thorsellia kenyensis]|uniref:Alpha-D-ribose 1-methylphosphonate 5-triphosphate diphosphatase n=1 Tax=Thorsellia kenyensis TaxID=1549888 RepID=A0ABV6C6K8_9GAMM